MTATAVMTDRRVTPHDISAERLVLGACLVAPECLDELGETLEPAHFFRVAHQALYRQLLAMRAAGEAIDLGTVAAGLSRHGVDLRPAEVSAFADGMPRRAHAMAYAQIVRGHWFRRELIRAGSQLVDDAHDPTQPAPEVFARAEQALYGLGARTVSSDWQSAQALAADIVTAVEEAQQGEAAGLLTGLRDLDDLLGGLKRGDLVLVGARPSVGKTALAMQVALHASSRVPVAVVSIEMSTRQLMLRAASSEASVDGWRMKQARLTDAELWRIGQATTGIAGRDLHVLDAPNLNPLKVRSKLRQLRSTLGRDLGLIVLDYLQMLDCLPEHRRETRTNQVGGISRALKLMAREFDAPFLVLAQLNRNVERTGDRAPVLADLRDSGSLEQDADVVLMLHRQPAPEGVTPPVQLHVEKHRNGPRGVVDLVWRKEFTKFADAAPEGAR